MRPLNEQLGSRSQLYRDLYSGARKTVDPHSHSHRSGRGFPRYLKIDLTGAGIEHRRGNTIHLNGHAA